MVVAKRMEVMGEVWWELSNSNSLRNQFFFLQQPTAAIHPLSLASRDFNYSHSNACTDA